MKEALANIGYPARWLNFPARPGLTYFFEALHSLTRDRGGTRDAAESVRRDLQGGKLATVFDWADGRLTAIAPSRWIRSEHLWWRGFEVGRSPESGAQVRGDVYVVTDANAAGLGAPPWECEEWDPTDNETLKAWCQRHEVLRETGRRLAEQRILNPSMAAHYRVMSAIWGDARRRGRGDPKVQASAKTIEQVFQRGGLDVADMVRTALRASGL